MMEIPLTAGIPFQQFDVSLGRIRITFELNYVQSGQWSMNLYRQQELIAAGLMLESGVDLTRGRFLGIGSLVFIGDDTTFTNLGINNRLIWVPNE
ncbi:phage baseplate plug family protein [Sessilibacter corallicola]|uniref:phage baseplate plug family protein n=1 Tax=Sessilibacter corallicola TaxID=2904075 RepID=UPI001E348709|nr:hypothetical protein [Sessilibacter corallicola]MCE2029298.1 hypothetical protein [Sessilibacter corallicola]